MSEKPASEETFRLGFRGCTGISKVKGRWRVRGVRLCKVWRLEVTAEGLKPWLAQWLEMREQAGQGLGLRAGKHPVECTVSEG